MHKFMFLMKSMDSNIWLSNEYVKYVIYIKYEIYMYLQQCQVFCTKKVGQHFTAHILYTEPSENNS